MTAETTFLDLLAICLACWRLSSLLAKEAVFRGLRERLGVVHDPDGDPVGWSNPVAEGISCLWCVSMWLSPLVVAAFFLSPLLVYPLAISAAVCFLDSFGTHLLGWRY